MSSDRAPCLRGQPEKVYFPIRHLRTEKEVAVEDVRSNCTLDDRQSPKEDTIIMKL
jgi:hypothetical protein